MTIPTLSSPLKSTQPGVKPDLSMDVLRSLAILYIVGFWHPYASSKVFACCYTPATIMLSFCVLGLFCFISGLLISRKHASGFNHLKEVGVFYQRRLLRIYPLYVIALIAFFWKGLITQGQLVSGVFLCGAIANSNLLTLWFVNLIVVFYLVTPLLLYRFDLKRNLIGILIAYVALMQLGITKVIDPRLAHYFIIYGAGVLLAHSPSAWQWITRKGWTLLPWFLVAGWAATHRHEVHGKHLRFVLNDLAVLCSIPSLLMMGEYLSRILNAKAVRFVSYSAFALYLFHRIIWGAVYAYLPYYPATPANRVLYEVCLLLPASIVISYFIQLVYDKVLDGMGLGRSRTRGDALPERVLNP